MRRWLIALVVLAVLVAGVFAAAVVTLNSVDWSEYQAPVAEAVRDATGRDLAFGGPLAVQIGFSPSVSASNVSLSNAAWGSRPEMVTFERALVRVKLLPLLFGRVEVRRVELIGADILLETDAEGVGNWVFGSDEPAAVPDPATPPVEGESGAIAAVVHAAVIENARLLYRDGVTGESQRFTIDRLAAETKGEGETLSLSLAAHYGEEALGLEGSIDGLSQLIAGDPVAVDLDLRAGGATIRVVGRVGTPPDGQGVDLTLGFEAETLAGLSGLAQTEVPGLGPISLDAQVVGGGDAYQVTGLVLEIGGTRIEGDVRARLGGDRPAIEATLRSPRIDLADLQEPGQDTGDPGAAATKTGGDAGDGRVFSAEPLELEGLSAADVVLSLTVGELVAAPDTLTDLSLSLTLAAGKLAIKPLVTTYQKGRIEAKVDLDSQRDRPRLAADVEIRGLDIGALARAQGSEILSGGAADIDVKVAGRGASVRAIMASLDGRVSVEMGRATIHDEWAELAMASVEGAARGDISDRAAEVHCVVADFKVAGGVATPAELVVDTKSLALVGRGEIDLRDERIRLKFDRQAWGLSASGALPPFQVGGTLADPKPGLDPVGLAGSALDFGSQLLAGGKIGGATAPTSKGAARCREVYASYVAAKERGREKRKDVSKSVKDLKKDGKEVFGRLKGLLGD